MNYVFGMYNGYQSLKTNKGGIYYFMKSIKIVTSFKSGSPTNWPGPDLRKETGINFVILKKRQNVLKKGLNDQKNYPYDLKININLNLFD